MYIATIFVSIAIAMALLMPIQESPSSLSLGGCNTDWMNVFLKQLSEAYPDDYILLVMDNAVWHKSSTLEKPHNIGFEFIPPYTPEMNPIEQVWAEIRKRRFKNKAFKTLDDVINKLQEVIRELDWSILKPIVSRQWLKNTWLV